MPEVITSGDAWLRMSLALLLVIGLVYLSAWLLKRISRGQTGEGLLQGSIKVLARKPLGEKRYLMVVRVVEKVLLLGVTPHSITVLTDLVDFPETDDQQPNLFERFMQLAGKGAEGRK